MTLFNNNPWLKFNMHLYGRCGDLKRLLNPVIENTHSGNFSYDSLLVGLLTEPLFNTKSHTNKLRLTEIHHAL